MQRLQELGEAADSAEDYRMLWELIMGRGPAKRWAYCLHRKGLLGQVFETGMQGA